MKRDFNSVAASWDESPRRLKLAADIVAAVRAHVPLSEEWDCLELGCGTGLVTLGIAPHVGSVLAVDGSSGMLARLEQKVSEGGIANVHLQQLELEHGQLPQSLFHLVLAAMLLHHIPDLAPLLREIRGRMHPGGWIALADLDAEDGSFHDQATGVFHHGFSRERMTALLDAAGYTSITVVSASEIVKGERRYPVLLSLARC